MRNYIENYSPRLAYRHRRFCKFVGAFCENGEIIEEWEWQQALYEKYYA